MKPAPFVFHRASSVDDAWHRGNEIRFERYAVRWVISGLEYEKQKELLARYRMADSATQERWSRPYQPPFCRHRLHREFPIRRA